MEDPKKWADEAIKRKKIIDLAIKKYRPSQITAMTGYSEDDVLAIIKDAYNKSKFDETHREILKEIFKEKVPALQNIVGLTLALLTESLMELSDPKIKEKMIKSVGDLKSLTMILTEVNNLLRLENGQATTTIDITSKSLSYQQTRVVLQELSKIDPVFEYPQLPDGKPLPF